MLMMMMLMIMLVMMLAMMMMMLMNSKYAIGRLCVNKTELYYWKSDGWGGKITAKYDRIQILSFPTRITTRTCPKAPNLEICVGIRLVFNFRRKPN